MRETVPLVQSLCQRAASQKKTIATVTRAMAKLLEEVTIGKDQKFTPNRMP